MNIAVINGSPKGNYSITLQSVLYLQKRYTSEHFEIFNAGNRIKSLEKDFSPLAQLLEQADMVLFAYPVYTFIAPYQLHRTIELIKENRVNLNGKFAAQISTSKHFYDVTAHEYIKENALDMGMRYVGGLSADMEDLLTSKGQQELCNFWEYTLFKCGCQPAGQPSRQYDIAIVTNSRDDAALDDMINTFQATCSMPTRIVNIARFPFTGGCLGCFHCAGNGQCIYKDGFGDFLRDNILKADAIVYAYTIKDHSMGADFKIYDDRQFCNGHRMMTIGMPIAYLVNGKLSAENNLQTIMEARAEVGRNMLCGIVCNETGDSAKLHDQLHELSEKLLFCLNHKTLLPANFYGVGGTKIFRDLIYLMRGLMQADHKFYRKHGIYDDFPQRHMGMMLKMKLVGFLANNRKIRARMGNKMNEGMVAPYKTVIEKVVPENPDRIRE